MAYIFSSLALLVSVVSFFYLRFFVKRRTAIERIPEETQEAVQQILDEIDRITDRDSQLVEERVKQLKIILAETDRRIATLSREVESRPRRDTAYSELGKARQTHSPAPEEKEEPPSRAALEMTRFLQNQNELFSS
ncbi:MAG: hypothetical protein LBT01_01140 [Spirochaetaceae bacterium]|jgi:hypothetical protein|nr:hypothetical protein [Spirochaetaceae bacterium]